jgi:hypothetical protein
MQKDEVLGRWNVEHETNECELRLELLDGCHIIPKYTIIIDSGFTFTLFVYNWPIHYQKYGTFCSRFSCQRLSPFYMPNIA